MIHYMVVQFVLLNMLNNSFAALTQPSLSPPTKTIVLRIKTLTSKFDPDYAAVNVTYNSSFVTFALDIKKPLNAPLMLRTFASIRIHGAFGHQQQESLAGGNGGPHMYKTVTNTTLNYCEFLKHPQFDPVVNLLYTTIVSEPQNHFYDRCPIAIVSEIWEWEYLYF